MSATAISPIPELDADPFSAANPENPLPLDARPPAA